MERENAKRKVKQKVIGLALKYRRTNQLSFILPEVDFDYFREASEEALETDWEDIQFHYQTVLVEIAEIEDYEEKNNEIS
jgi:hypothetical protein